MATPLTDKLLHWGEVENSIMYCLAGVEVSVYVSTKSLVCQNKGEEVECSN